MYANVRLTDLSPGTKDGLNRGSFVEAKLRGASTGKLMRIWPLTNLKQVPSAETNAV